MVILLRLDAPQKEGAPAPNSSDSSLASFKFGDGFRSFERVAFERAFVEEILKHETTLS